MFNKTVLTLIVAALFISGSFVSQPAVVHAEEFSADIVTDMHTGSVNGKIYFKNTRVNRSEMMGMINIVKYPEVYQLFTGTKKFHVSNVTELEADDPMAGITDFEAWAKQNDLKKTGTESIEGFACDIYEGTIEIDEDTGETAPMKIWLSRKLQYPLKTETMMPEPVGRLHGAGHGHAGHEPVFRRADAVSRTDGRNDETGTGYDEKPATGITTRRPS